MDDKKITELRAEIAALAPGLTVDAVGTFLGTSDLDAIVSDQWGQYSWRHYRATRALTPPTLPGQLSLF